MAGAIPIEFAFAFIVGRIYGPAVTTLCQETSHGVGVRPNPADNRVLGGDVFCFGSNELLEPFRGENFGC